MSQATPTKIKDSGRRLSSGSGSAKRQCAYLLMVLPGVLFLLAFNYLPMPGVILAFKFYQMQVPPEGALIQNTFLYSMFHSQWNGLNNFTYLLKDAPMLIRNTVGYNLLFMVVGLVLQVGLAVIVNEMRNRKTAKVYHTIMFMPYFVSWIVVMYALYAMIAANGFFNQLITASGGTAVKFYNQKQYWPWIFLVANIWKYTGQGSIIYLATLTGFDEQLYEAGAIDGASKWQQIRYVTLPHLRTMISILLILNVGKIFAADFGLFYNVPMQNGALFSVTQVIDTYIYRVFITTGNISQSSAAGLLQNVIGFVCIMLANAVVKKIDAESSLF